VPGDTCFYRERGRLALALKDQGISGRETARLSGITPRRVCQIVAESRAESSPA
jgi:hypothetical protein